MKVLLALFALLTPSCLHVYGQSWGVMWGTDVEGFSHPGAGGLTFSKSNNSESFKAGAATTGTYITTQGVIAGLKEAPKLFKSGADGVSTIVKASN